MSESLPAAPRALPPHLTALTPLERAFVAHLAAGSSLAAAAVQAGYADYRSAYQVIERERVAHAVLVECETREAMHAGEMLDIQLHLARHAKKEDIRDRASARLLERAIPAVRKTEITHRTEMTPEQDAERIAALLAKAGYRVEGKKLAPIDVTYTEVLPMGGDEPDCSDL